MTARRIAVAFVADLREALTAEQFEEIRRRNATPAYARACASHDFIDANESMAAAFETVMGYGPSACSDADTALWNAAWEIARHGDLTTAHCAYCSHAKTEHAFFPAADGGLGSPAPLCYADYAPGDGALIDHACPCEGYETAAST